MKDPWEAVQEGKEIVRKIREAIKCREVVRSASNGLSGAAARTGDGKK